MSQTIQIKESEEEKRVSSYPGFLLKEISFNQDEYIVKASRKHWVVFRNPFLIGFFIPFVAIFLAIFLSTPFLSLPEFISDKVAMVLMLIAPFFFVIGFVMFLWQLFLWYRTFYIVTNQRLIKMEQQTIFSSKIHQMYIDKVQDAICRISGFQAVLYGYGDISIQGSSETAQIEFKQTGHPKEMQQIIAKETGRVFSA